MGEDDDRRLLVYLREVLAQPLPLRLTHLEGALPVVVEPRDDSHPLLGRVTLGGPEVLLHDAVQHHEVDALVLERVVVRAEHLLPLLPQVEIPIVLTDHHPDGGLEVLEDLPAEIELVGGTELSQVAAEEHEVGLGIQGVDVLHGLHGRLGEAVGHTAGIEMGVRHVGEPERALRTLARRRSGAGHLHELKAVGLENAGRCSHAGELQGDAQEVAPVAVP